MKNDPRDGLPIRDPIEEELRQMAEETPETPVDFHAKWMSIVEAEIMNKETENNPIVTEANPIESNPIESIEPKKKTKKPFAWKRWIGIAAAAVFILGGTAITRDILVPRRKPVGNSSGSSYQSSYKSESPSSSAMGTSTTALYAADADYAMSDSAPMMYEEAAVNGASFTETVAVKDPRTKIIRTVSMTLATREYDLCNDAFRTSCTSLGGWIESANESTSTGNLRTVDYVFRIPAEFMDSFLNAMPGDSYRVVRSSETSVDVSESYYDTKTRLESQRKLLERLENMVTTTADLSDLLELEREIADVQYRIDSYQGSLNSTDAKVNYGTVKITLREETEAAKVEYKELSFFERLSASLENGFTSFGEFLEDIVLFLAEMLPLILIIAVIVVVVIVIRKSVKKKKANK